MIDLLLIVVVECDGNFELYCVVVGEYILFGGDNMDFVFVYVVVCKFV